MEANLEAEKLTSKTQYERFQTLDEKCQTLLREIEDLKTP